MAASSGWMWIDHARAITSTTHIDNLVDAIELALTKGQPGEAYLILEGGQRGCRPAGPLHPLLARRHDCGGVGGRMAAVPSVGRSAPHPARRHGHGPRLHLARPEGQERTRVSATS